MVDPSLVQVDDPNAARELIEHEAGIVLPEEQAAIGVAQEGDLLDFRILGADVVSNY